MLDFSLEASETFCFLKYDCKCFVAERISSTPKTPQLSGGLRVRPAAHSQNARLEASIGPKGDTLKLHGVSLEIPPGLSEQKKITLGIVREKSQQPHLDAGTGLLSPVVSCETGGRALETHAKLLLPHCAHAEGESDIKKRYEITFWTSGASWHEADDWVATKSTDWTEQVEITNTHVKFDACYFKKVAITGKVQQMSTIVGKKVSLLAYAPLDHPQSSFEIHVLCMNDYGSTKDVEVMCISQQPYSPF